ncbi:Com family DNA-binding transcriptional regulator [Aureimonas sp. N4]|uniref:Com family DNA-binding transcriptional regulator n=1 Tax=Aureimonas sp. N4 TaxID=1638165 RepID=UPI0009E8AC52
MDSKALWPIVRTKATPMEPIRCGCRALLFRMERHALKGALEIKCRRCGRLNHLRPSEPSFESPELPIGETHANQNEPGRGHAAAAAADRARPAGEGPIP